MSTKGRDKQNAINKEAMGAKRAAGLRFNQRTALDTEESWRRQMATFPDDTRDLTARVCGDPLPGRSALDRARA